MNITTSNNSRRLTLEYQTLIGIMVILALMLYGVWRYPASLSQGGLVSFLVTVGALLAYGGAALWARRQSSDRMQITLGNGVKIGLLLGVTAVLNHTFEIFGTLGSSVSAILGVSMWGLMFLSFGVAGSATYHLVGSLRLSIISSIWGALISTVIILLYGYLVGLLFMPHMQQILQGAFVQSGMTDPQAFVIQNTLGSGTSHILLAPVIAGIFGFAGGFARAIFGSVQRRVAVALGVFELLLVGAGIAAIRFASSINRTDRPPYIMFGLLALGLTMACAHPILTAIRRQATTE